MPFPAVLNLSSLNGINGFSIYGVDPHDYAGSTVASGDVNGDGIADIVIGADRWNQLAAAAPGKAYVVFGTTSASAVFGTSFNLSSLNGTNGFRVTGESIGDRFGNWASVGDVNNDGFADVIVGASAADPSGRTDAGAAYVVFGKATGTGVADINLSTPLTAAQGFKISGAAAGVGVVTGDRTGSRAGDNDGGPSRTGDFNGDGIDDVLVRAPFADTNGTDSGTVYILFGRTSGLANLDLTSLTTTQGIRINGEPGGVGLTGAFAGDFNGDGIDDVAIGAPSIHPNGSAYVVYGRTTGLADINLDALSSTQGFQMVGTANGDVTGASVSHSGDVNGDGFADILVSAQRADDNASDAGGAYVVFGTGAPFTSDLQLSSLNGTNGFKIRGETADDLTGRSIGSAGDVNGDGFGDILIGAPFNSAGAFNGNMYVVFGKPSSFSPNLDLSTLAAGNGSAGFKIVGPEPFGGAGEALASGDINGDGFDDLLLGSGANDAPPNTGVVNAGVTYVMYGGASFGAPQITSNGGRTTAAVSVAENTTAVADVDATDPDLDPVTYSISGGADQSQFTINAMGALSFSAAPDFENRRDANADGIYEVTVQASDGVLVDAQRIAVTVTDVVNEGITNGNGGGTLNGTGGNDIIDAQGGNDVVNAGAGDDTVLAGSGDDVVNGGDGNDTITGGTGTDVALGGNGNDTFIALSNDGNDGYFGGPGIDTFDFSQITVALTVNLGMNSPFGLIDGVGSASGNVAANYPTDTLNSIENVTAGSGGDIINGDNLANALRGGLGNDTITGRGGPDTLQGGADADIFVYSAVGETGTTAATRDVILDFEGAGAVGGDLINLAAIDANATQGGNQAFTFIGTAAFSDTNPGAGLAAGQIRYFFDTSGNTVVQGNVNNNLTPDFEILLVGIRNLTAGDFIL